MKISRFLGWCLVAVAFSGGSSALAAGRKKELNNKATYTQKDAVKGQEHIQAAMTTPMLDLLKLADVQHPEAMLRYGLALDLGRPSVSSQLSPGEKEKLKGGFRQLLDIFLTSRDKFDIQFDEDAMLDQSEFWIYLAKHVGRKNNRTQMEQPLGAADSPAGTMGFYLPQRFDEDSEKLNLDRELVLKSGVVNASTTCAQTAFAFARMEKVQKVDIAATKLTQDQFAKAQETAARTYVVSYKNGILACGGKAFFNQTADFARQNLGVLGTMAENPAAVLTQLEEPSDEELIE
ncbi:hypothetical protein ABI_05340 [Asticcacaulis biprosthecium C19]|uniref:Uncharacterized protein n=1 Tax=Asticcacaulis biprosthecium C19 TaxID=715226 RepID=F4QKE9_9CAUL|nr:hypothetical protein [Asticcacaulis biprosthecium]EGF92101.1 hypothetical protein ABI_05340 [Asticcacaulis biprosthecium C19]